MTGAMNGGILGGSLLLSGGSLLYWGPGDAAPVATKAAVQALVQAAGDSLLNWNMIIGGLVVLAILAIFCFDTDVKELVHHNPKGTLKIKILSGKGLVNTKSGYIDKFLGAKQDSFVRATVGTVHYQTPVVASCESPDYAAATQDKKGVSEFVFAGLDDSTANHTMKLEVFHGERAVGHEKFLLSAGADVDIKEISFHPGRWIEKEVATHHMALVGEKGGQPFHQSKQVGTVTVSMKWEHDVKP